MKKLILICLSVLLSSELSAQILSNEDEFFDMKTSAKYYYGEYTSAVDSIAKAMALANLIENNRTVAIKPEDVVYYYHFYNHGGTNYICMGAFVEREKYETKKQVAPCPLTTVETSGKSVPAETARWKSNVFEKLLKIEKTSDMQEYLSRLTVSNIIDNYGTFRDCNDKSAVCWIVFDQNDNLVALLDEGKIQRYNYKTKSTDSLNDYIKASYSLIWFTFNE